jgi:hypothetical protein
MIISFVFTPCGITRSDVLEESVTFIFRVTELG